MNPKRVVHCKCDLQLFFVGQYQLLSSGIMYLLLHRAIVRVGQWVQLHPSTGTPNDTPVACIIISCITTASNVVWSCELNQLSAVP